LAPKARFASLFLLPAQAYPFGYATALWVKQHFTHDEILLKNLRNSAQVPATPRGATNHIISQSSSGLQCGVTRTVQRNQTCCIKIVKWFYRTLVEHLENFANLSTRVMSQTITNGLLRSRKEVTGRIRLRVSVTWKAFLS
jgi:hypothetical protein